MDPSAYVVGDVLSHVLPDGSEKPVAYVPCSLSTSEGNFAQIEKEALSIIFGIRCFHQYLYGRPSHLWLLLECSDGHCSCQHILITFVTNLPQHMETWMVYLVYLCRKWKLRQRQQRTFLVINSSSSLKAAAPVSLPVKSETPTRHYHMHVRRPPDRL